MSLVYKCAERISSDWFDLFLLCYFFREQVGKDFTNWFRVKYLIKNILMTESLSLMCQQEREHLSQLQQRLLTVKIISSLNFSFSPNILRCICSESQWRYYNRCLQRIDDHLFMSIENVRRFSWRFLESYQFFSISNEAKFLWENLPANMKTVWRRIFSIN